MESKSQEFRQYLKQQIRMNHHLIGVATGPVEGIVGFIGASSIVRIAAEKGIREQAEVFKRIKR